jgi:hypothetical protein
MRRWRRTRGRTVTTVDSRVVTNAMNMRARRTMLTRVGEQARTELASRECGLRDHADHPNERRPRCCPPAHAPRDLPVVRAGALPSSDR